MLSPHTSIALLAVACLAACKTTGDTKGQQCATLKAAINAAGRKIQAAPTVGGSPEDIQSTAAAQAEAMAGAKATLAAATLADQTLVDQRAHLVAIADKKVVVLRAMAKAGAQNDETLYDELSREADSLADAENAATAKIIAYCGR